MVNRRDFLRAGTAGLALLGKAAPSPRLNVVQILADDMGYGDPHCFGGEIETPNIDRLAAKGIRFTQAYCASPVCSASRVGITTGQFPSRHFIYSYLDTRARQKELHEANFLALHPPLIAKAFQDAGYATGHFGKWHMGGGRDVGEAPPPTAYGFDESLTSFEGLGDRVLPPGRLSELNEKLGTGKIDHAPQAELTEIYVGRSIDFAKRAVAAGKPFYLHVWPNEVHDPFLPKPELMKKFERFASNKYKQQYYAMIDNLDSQIGRLVAAIEQMGQAQNTLFIFLSDNGPTAWPYYYKEKLDPPGSTAGLRGRKWSLYEGGTRTPLIARWDGHIPAGKTDTTSVVATTDFFPTCCAMANVPAPKVEFDGQDMSAALLGKPVTRRKDIFWDYGRTADMQRPGLVSDQSPNLALRSGSWKVLINDDGSKLELYDFRKSDKEQENVAAQHPKEAKQLSERLLKWRKDLPVWTS